MRCVIYARYSTEAQSVESTADQLRRCRAHAAAQGWEVAAEHSDDGISGAAIGNRPGAKAALAAATAGDVLLVVDVERLARSQDLAPLVTRLRHRGVRVLGLLDHFDSEAATAGMQAGLSGIMSEAYRSSIARRTHSALDMRARQGRPTGRVAYGYADEAQAAVVREIFARFAAGESMRQIAGDLNARAVPSPGATWQREIRRADGRWMVSTLHAMLHNERYTGRVVWNRSRWVRDPDTGVRQRRERPEAEWVVREDADAQLVDRATWAAVQARLNVRRDFYRGGKGARPTALLSGLLRCEACGGAMVLVGEPRRYACSSHRHGGEAACSMRMTVRRDVAEEAILDPITEQLLAPEAVRLAVTSMREALRQEVEATADPAETARLEAQVAQVEALIGAGVLSGEVAQAALGQARDALRRGLRRSAASSGPARLWPTAALEGAYREAVARWKELVRQADPDGARAALRDLIGEVPVRPAAGGQHLEALLAVNAQPLLAAVGHHVPDGSGGAIWTRSAVALVRGKR